MGYNIYDMEYLCILFGSRFKKTLQKYNVKYRNEKYVNKHM